MAVDEVKNVSLNNYLLHDEENGLEDVEFFTKDEPTPKSAVNKSKYSVPETKNWFYKSLLRFIKPLVKASNNLKYYGGENLEDVIDSSFVLTSNHEYALDPFYVGSGLKGNKIRFISKRENFETWFKHVIGPLGAVPLDEDRRMNEESRKGVKEAVLRDEVIGICPEGTRTDKGELGRFHTGAVRLCVEYGLPYVPSALCVSEGGKAFPLMGRVSVLYGRPCYLDPNVDWDYEKYKQASEDMREQVKSLMKGELNVPKGRFEISKEEFNALMKKY